MQYITLLKRQRCRRCGNLLQKYKKKYCVSCAPIADIILQRKRQQRYRNKHGNDQVKKWIKEHPEKRKLHIQNYMKKHRKKLVDYNRKYREEHPKWYRNQLDKNNALLKERRHTKGNCHKCGRPANKSSMLGLCTSCLFRRSMDKYRRPAKEKLIFDKKMLCKEFKHLIPDGLDKRFIDEFASIQKSKVNLGIIHKNGDERIWRTKTIQKIWDFYDFRNRS